MDKLTDLQFSQASLQDFIDCRRRFYYRYVQRLAWPALEAEPALANEQWMKQGTDFHQLVHRYVLGIPVERLTPSVGGNLTVWWQSFLDHVPFDRDARLFPERLLVTELDGKRLVAKFDLIVAASDGSVDIYDWKTSRKPPKRAVLAEQMQSKVYPLVLAKAGDVLGLELTAPEQVRMTYWYVNRPEEPEVFNYSQEQFEADREQITAIANEILALDDPDQFTLTEEVRRCRFCVYRSLCERGETAGDFLEDEDDFEIGPDFDLDFDLIEEIEF